MGGIEADSELRVDSSASFPSTPTSTPSEPQAQSAATKTAWWGSLVGGISNVLSGSGSSASEQQHSPSIESPPPQPSQPAVTNEASRSTSEDDKLHTKKNKRSEQGEFLKEGDAVRRNESNNSTTTAQVSSTSTEPHVVTATLDSRKTDAPHKNSRSISLKGNLDVKRSSLKYSQPPQHSAENDSVRPVDVSDTPIRISRPLTVKGPLMRSHPLKPAPSLAKDGSPNGLNQTKRGSYEPPQTTRRPQDPAEKRKARASPKGKGVEPRVTSRYEVRQTVLDEEDHNKQDSGQEDGTNRQPAKMVSLPQDVDIKQQLQQLIQQIRHLQEVLDPSSISQDAPQTSSRTSQKLNPPSFSSQDAPHTLSRIPQRSDPPSSVYQRAPMTYLPISQTNESPPSFLQDVPKTLPRQPSEVNSTTPPPQDESKSRPRNSPNPDSQTLTSRDESTILPRTAKARNNVHALPSTIGVDVQDRSSKRRVGTMIHSFQPERRILKPTLRYAEIERFYMNVRNRYGSYLGDSILLLERMESRRIALLLAKFKEGFIAQSGVPALERMLRRLRFSRTTASSPSGGVGLEAGLPSHSRDQLYYRCQRIMSIHYHVLHEVARELEDMASPRLAPLTAKVNEIMLRHQTIAIEKKSQKIRAMKQERAEKARQRKAQHPPVVKNSVLSESRVQQVRPDASTSIELTNHAHKLNMSLDKEAHQPVKQHGLVKAEIDKQQCMIHNTGLQSQKAESEKTLKTNHLEQSMASQPKSATGHDQVTERRYETQRLSRNIHTHSRAMSSSKHSATAKQSKQAPSLGKDDEVVSPSMGSSEADAKAKNERSLLEELFPEASSYIQPYFSERSPYPKLDLPSGKGPLVVRQHLETKKSLRERVIESFQRSGERITALQFLNCSTEFTESDFRRLIPKGKHIESWATKGEFYKIIPGRDPLSLERLPFYYLLFKSTESALAYQANVARLHKLCSLRQASNIMSVMPVPKGLLEDGEDISAAMSSYLLKPSSLRLNLNMVMQPYNPALRTLLENGGYRPIVPSLAPNGKPLYKVLLQINGWEPTEEDLYKILYRHARHRGITWPFHTESSLAIRKLRDVIDLKTRMLPISSSSPRAKNSASPDQKTTEPDPTMGFMLPEAGQMEGNISQMVMGRVYNQWIVEFDEEDGAKRFSRLWNRRVLPQPRFVTWRDTEEERMVSAEFLW